MTLSREDMPLTKACMRVRPTVIMLPWPTSAIGVWLLPDFNRQFNKSSDCFSTRWEIGLAAAPVVYRPQKLLRYPHLKRAILRAFRWAATRPNAAAHFVLFVLTKMHRTSRHSAGRWQAANSPPALTQATEVPHGPG